MNRRQMLLGGASCGAVLALAPSVGTAQGPAALGQLEAGVPPDHPLLAEWSAWKALCLSPEGRVIDHRQQSSSHSEGQSYGLLLAALFRDLSAARSIIDWTDRNLAVRSDSLLAWKWLPDTQPAVADLNNASDGDLVYAWALTILAPLLDAPHLKVRAQMMAADLLRLCTLPAPDASGALALLPGAEGFVFDDGLVLNPSYYVVPAMRALGSRLDQPQWSAMAEVGEALLDRLGSGAGPVPDWVKIGPEGIRPAPERFSNRSGYEAIRVPLFIMMDGRGDSPAVQRYVEAVKRAAAASVESGTAIVFDPASGSAAEFSAEPGYAAVAALARCAASSDVGAPIPLFTAEQSYYPATLHLMALVVQATLYPRCVPI